MHVLFDLDGTLTDSKAGIIASMRFAFSKLDIELSKDINLESYIGPPLRDTFIKLCGAHDIAETAISIYRERFSTSGLFENRVYEGIPQCLDRLVGKAESIHVATSKPTVYSKQIIEHFKLSQYFNSVHGSNLDETMSDKTELIDHILKTEGFRPRDTVMIGDRSFDMVGARNNDMKAIGVLWGYGNALELNNAGADALCRHPGELDTQIFT